MVDKIQQLSAGLLGISEQLPAANPPHSVTILPSAKWDKYKGNPDYCHGFLLLCRLHLDAVSGLSDQQKLTYLLRRLTGKAVLWATAIWECNARAHLYLHMGSLLTSFLMCLRTHLRERRSLHGLLPIKQGNGRVVKYALKFCALATESGWNKSTLKAVFHQGLNDDVIIELTYRDEEAKF